MGLGTGDWDGVRCAVELPQGQHDGQEEHHEIPVANELAADDASQLLVAAELVEYRRGGAAHGELEIDHVAEVRGQPEGIEREEHPLA